jgi:hypothetical protein
MRMKAQNPKKKPPTKNNVQNPICTNIKSSKQTTKVCFEISWKDIQSVIIPKHEKLKPHST